jgi:hypothetical protein
VGRESYVNTKCLPNEHSKRSTFYRKFKAIFEDVCNLFLNESTTYHHLMNPVEDLYPPLDYMVPVLTTFQGKKLGQEFFF